MTEAKRQEVQEKIVKFLREHPGSPAKDMIHLSSGSVVRELLPWMEREQIIRSESRPFSANGNRVYNHKVYWVVEQEVQ